MWNAISLVQDLNSCRHVQFLRRQPLHHGHFILSFMDIWILLCASHEIHRYKHAHAIYTLTQTHIYMGPLDWGYRIHRLHLCRGVRRPQRVSWIYIPSLALLPGLLWPGVVAPKRDLFIGQIELNRVITQDWIVWNLLFSHIIVCKQKTVLMLYWIVWNRTAWSFNYV